MSSSIWMKMLSNHSLFVFTSSFNSHVKRKVCLLTVCVWICQRDERLSFCGTFFKKIRSLPERVDMKDQFDMRSFRDEGLWHINFTTEESWHPRKERNMKGNRNQFVTDRRRKKCMKQQQTELTGFRIHRHTSVSVMSSSGQSRDFTLSFLSQFNDLWRGSSLSVRESECIEVMPFPKFRAWMSCDTPYSIMWFTRLSCHLSSAYRFNSTEYYIRSLTFPFKQEETWGKQKRAFRTMYCDWREEEFLFPYSCNNWSSYLQPFRWEKSALEWNIAFLPGLALLFRISASAFGSLDPSIIWKYPPMQDFLSGLTSPTLNRVKRKKTIQSSRVGWIRTLYVQWILAPRVVSSTTGSETVRKTSTVLLHLFPTRENVSASKRGLHFCTMWTEKSEVWKEICFNHMDLDSMFYFCSTSHRRAIDFVLLKTVSRITAGGWEMRDIFRIRLTSLLCVFM